MAKGYYYTVERFDDNWDDWMVLHTEPTMEDGKMMYRAEKIKGIYAPENLRLLQNVKHYPSQDVTRKVILGSRK